MFATPNIFLIYLSSHVVYWRVITLNSLRKSIKQYLKFLNCIALDEYNFWIIQTDKQTYAFIFYFMRILEFRFEPHIPTRYHPPYIRVINYRAYFTYLSFGDQNSCRSWLNSWLRTDDCSTAADRTDDCSTADWHTNGLSILLSVERFDRCWLKLLSSAVAAGPL